MSELLGVGTKRTKATILETPQNVTRSAIIPLSPSFCSDRMYNLKPLQGRFATDTCYADINSLCGNTCCQVYSHIVGFFDCYPKLNARGDSLRETLDDFVHYFGLPDHLTFDGLQSQVGKNTKFKKNLCRYRINHHIATLRQPNENPAEGVIREIKHCFNRSM